MDISSLAPGTVQSTGTSTAKGFDDLATEDFVSILLAELQNQNPLEPMDNAKLLDQFNSINSLSSTTKLIDTLESMTLSQSLGSAGNLIGKAVTGKIGNQTIEGVVDKAIVEDGQVLLSVGDQLLPIENVTELKVADN